MKITTQTSPLTGAQLAEMIGMTEQQMICAGFDLDLADAARWLIDNEVDLDNRDDCVAALGKTTSARFVDAAVIFARSCTLTTIERDIITEAAKQVWNEPDPSVVKLQDGRQVLREFYDPAIHGSAVE